MGCLPFTFFYYYYTHFQGKNQPKTYIDKSDKEIEKYIILLYIIYIHVWLEAENLVNYIQFSGRLWYTLLMDRFLRLYI